MARRRRGRAPLLDLAPIARFRRLRFLSLDAYGTNAAAVGTLPELEEPYLTGRKGVDYRFLSCLPRLSKLSLGFGRCEGFADIAIPRATG